MDLRASPSAAERGTWPRSLRRAILARSPPPCAHDNARLRLPAAPPPQNGEAGKKESMDHRLNQACRPSATRSSRSSLNCHRNDARIVENGLASRSGVSKSAKVVLVSSLWSYLPSPTVPLLLPGGYSANISINRWTVAPHSL